MGMEGAAGRWRWGGRGRRRRGQRWGWRRAGAKIKAAARGGVLSRWVAVVPPRRALALPARAGGRALAMGSRGAASRAPRAGRVCSHSPSKPQRLICLVYSPATRTAQHTHTDKRDVASTTLSATRSLGRWPPSCAAPERRRLAAAARHAAPLSSRVCGAHRPTPTHTDTQRAVHTPRACRLLQQTDGWGRPCSRDRPRALGPRLPTARAALAACGRRDTCAVVAYLQP